jgi:hypothetical protein
MATNGLDWLIENGPGRASVQQREAALNAEIAGGLARGEANGRSAIAAHQQAQGALAFLNRVEESPDGTKVAYRNGQPVGMNAALPGVAASGGVPIGGFAPWETAPFTDAAVGQSVAKMAPGLRDFGTGGAVAPGGSGGRPGGTINGGVWDLASKGTQGMFASAFGEAQPGAVTPAPVGGYGRNAGLWDQASKGTQGGFTSAFGEPMPVAGGAAPAAPAAASPWAVNPGASATPGKPPPFSEPNALSWGAEPGAASNFSKPVPVGGDKPVGQRKLEQFARGGSLRAAMALEDQRFAREQDETQFEREKQEKEAQFAARLSSYGGAAGALVQQGAIDPAQVAWVQGLPPKEQEGAMKALVEFGGFMLQEKAKAGMEAEQQEQERQAALACGLRPVPAEGTSTPYFMDHKGSIFTGAAKSGNELDLKSFGQDAAGNPIVGYPYRSTPDNQVRFQRVDVGGGAKTEKPTRMQFVPGRPGVTATDPGTPDRVFDPYTGQFYEPGKVPPRGGAAGAAAKEDYNPFE